MSESSARLPPAEEGSLSAGWGVLNSASVLACDLGAHIILWTKGCEQLYGYSASEAVGRQCKELLKTRFARPFEEIQQQVLGQGQWNGELEQWRKDGRRIAVASQWRLYRDSEGRPQAIVQTDNDITQIKEQESEIWVGASRLRLALGVARSIVYDINLKPERINAVDGLEEVLGYRPEEIGPSAQWWGNLVHPNDRGAWEQLVEALRHGEQSYHAQYRIRHRDGHYIYVSERARVLSDGQGEPLRVVGTVSDETEAKRVEQELEMARRVAEEANRYKDRFLATLGHELRNPLGTIVNAVELIEEDASQAQEQAGVISRQVRKLSRLVDDLLDVSRIAAGKIVLRRLPTDLRHVIQSAVESCMGSIQAQEHELEWSRPTEAFWVNGDPTRLEQVFTNILGNAIKYTPRHGRISIRLQRERDQAVVRIRDSGIGIPREMLVRLFEPFVQVSSALDRSMGGLGLGLSLVQSLVQMHGGEVIAHSEGVGRGSEFEVRLPLQVAAPEAVEPSPPEPLVPRTPRHRVLLVEDNEDARKVLAKLMQRWGHEVETAGDGLEAISKALANPPEIALIDIGLPGLDGYEVAHQIRKGGAADVRLVALTGHGLPEDQQRARDAGFDLHLLKPVEPQALSQLLTGLPAV